MINLTFYIQLPATSERLDAYNLTLQECEEVDNINYINNCEVDVDLYIDEDTIEIKEIIENAPNNICVDIDEEELQDDDLNMIKEVASEYHFLN